MRSLVLYHGPNCNDVFASAWVSHRKFDGHPPKCRRCDGDGKAHGADRPFEWSGSGTYPGMCPVCNGTGFEE